MTKLNQYLEKTSVLGTKNKPIAHEFNQAILLLWLFRIIIIGISIYCGYFFFNSYLQSHIESKAVVFYCSVLLSFFVESFAAIFLDKLFKFALKRQIKTATGLFLAVVLFYSLSFYSSTNGLALKQYANNDKSELIKNNTNIESENLSKQKENEISELQKNIELIKANPEGWQNSKRCILTGAQLETIKQYNEQIYKIRTDFKTDITKLNDKLEANVNENKIIATNEANKFYSFACFIMLFQIITSFMLRFFKFKIYHEVDEILAKGEQTQNVVSNLSNIVWSTLINRTNEMSELMLSNFNRRTLILNETIVTDIPTEQRKQIKGFRTSPINNDQTNTVNDIQTTLNVKVDDRSTVNVQDGERSTVNVQDGELKETDSKICLYCGMQFYKKHWNAKFCSDEHRIKFWEDKHKTKLNFKMKTK